MKYRTAIDIWQLDSAQRAALPIGQWVYAGDPSQKGRFFGEGAVTVVAWMGNAQGRYRSYMAALRDYGRSVRNRK